ncbi:hypothetical protein PIECOFPK_00683 [Mycovorax composti]|jgi:Beta-galactosidase/beta-glucuronidase|uniref:Sialate O-acetylesterase n=2 Tax=Chitinophagaceae TaxID=563835 RepID=A0ABZ2EHQ5_9BACT
MKKFALLGISIFSILTAHSQIKLPQLVRDSMILQRNAKVNIWGWASPGEKVTVNFKGKKYTTKAGGDGKWKVQLQPQPAGGPYTMTLSGKNKITLNHILIGDVWLACGQSNMEHQVRLHEVLYAREVATANYPEIRQFKVPNVTNLNAPQEDYPSGAWKWANPSDVREFSAVAYFFAKALYDRYHIPIGIINATWGGTPIEAWMSEEGFKEFPEIIKTIEKNKDTSYINSFRGGPPQFAMMRQPEDKGLEQKWYAPEYQPKGWRTIAIPGYWEDQGVRNLDGVVWYRREVDIPASMAGVPAKIFLGRIVDADEVYINGTKVGNTTYMYPQRRYPIPENVLKPGKNIIVVRVTNNAGKGGFVPDKPYYIATEKDTVNLTGYWQYKVGRVNRPMRGFGGGPRGIAFQNQPTALFNAMLAPAVNYTLKGFLWYQGESNTGKPDEYALLQPAMIKDWRRHWGNESLPFLFVQLPGFMDYDYLPVESGWAKFREAQAKSLSVPNTGMAVAIDLGEWNDIHPDRKKEVGERLALAARKITYGENIVYSGPIYQSAEISGDKIIISFTNTGSGLTTSDGEPLEEFAIAGEDKKFVWAKAVIEGDKVIVSSDEVKSPKYVRYAWADNPVNPNLINKEGLPASPFRTDN